VTFDPERHNLAPVWMPDQLNFLFAKVRGGKAGDRWSIYERSAEGAGQERLLFESATMAVPWTVSPDAAVLLFGGGTVREQDVDLWTLSLKGDPTPQLYIQSPGRQTQAQFSPDGRWVAYVSDETDRPEVYVQSYPRPDTKYQVSTGGGNQPRWRNDGRELYYRAVQFGSGLGTPIMGVALERQGDSLRFATPRALLETAASLTHASPTIDYAPSIDGQKFLRVRRAGAPNDVETRIPLTVVVNWPEELRRLTTTK
jgi:Tol biopolymer transport system component